LAAQDTDSRIDLTQQSPLKSQYCVISSDSSVDLREEAVGGMPMGETGEAIDRRKQEVQQKQRRLGRAETEEERKEEQMEERREEERMEEENEEMEGDVRERERGREEEKEEVEEEEEEEEEAHASMSSNATPVAVRNARLRRMSEQENEGTGKAQWADRHRMCSFSMDVAEDVSQDVPEDVGSKEPCIHPKESCMHPKEPCKHPKEPCKHPKESCIHPKEPCIHPTAPCIHPKEPCDAAAAFAHNSHPHDATHAHEPPLQTRGTEVEEARLGRLGGAERRGNGNGANKVGGRGLVRTHAMCKRPAADCRGRSSHTHTHTNTNTQTLTHKH